MLKQGDNSTESPALWKAGQELSEAIEREEARKKYENSDKLLKEELFSEKRNGLPEDITLLGPEALAEEKVKREKKSGKEKSLYGFSASLSRSEKIVNSIDEISSDEGRNLVAAVLGSKKFDGLSLLGTEEKSAEKESAFMDEKFHDGYESLLKMAEYNIKNNKTNFEFVEKEKLRDSEEYRIRKFDDSENLTEVEADLENDVEDYLSGSYLLNSFDDDEDEYVIPYESNKMRILAGSGQSNPTELSRLAEDLLAQNGIGTEALQGEFLQSAEETTDKEKNKENQSEAMKEILRKAEAEAQFQSDLILQQAKRQAEEILDAADKKARELAQEIAEKAESEGREKGYEEGYQQGQNQGLIDASNAVNEDMKREAREFREELQSSLEHFEEKQEFLLKENLDNLTNLALDVAEKVINISLTKSKDIVSKMIINAAEECRNKEWAKVYISNEDKEIAMNLEKELIRALNQISENVRVVVMDDEPSGTCIIETPDQIIDASADVQLENIKKIVKDSL